MGMEDASQSLGSVTVMAGTERMRSRVRLKALAMKSRQILGLSQLHDL